MRVDELFHSPSSLTQLDTREATSTYGLLDLLAAYSLKLGDDEYVFYFDACGGKPLEPTFGFGKVESRAGSRRELGISHELTNANTPFKIVGAAIQAITNYVGAHHPLSITFAGVNDRQQAFYGVLVKRFARTLPDGYKMIQREHTKRYYITRNPDLLAMPTSHLIEGRLDELFNEPVAYHELDWMFGPEAANRVKMHADFAFAFYIEGIEYISFFTEVKKKGWFECSFARIDPESGQPSYDLAGVNNGTQFKVYRLVMESMLRFIKQKKPITVQFKGYTQRQTDFYKKIVQAYQSRIPKPYFWAMDGKSTLVTRSKAVVPEQGYLDRLAAQQAERAPVEEDAHADLAANETATHIAHTFQNWLAANNEDKPLEDIMHTYQHPNNGDRILYATGPEIGLKEYPDLFIGFAFNPTRAYYGEPYGAAKGYHTVARNSRTGEKSAFVVLTCDKNPSAQTDVAWGLNIEFLVHELTHYLDRKRQSPTASYAGKKTDGTDPDRYKKYFNSPFEFNAFYQQGVHQLMRDIRARPPIGSRIRPKFETFPEFLSEFLYNFDYDFRANLDPTYKKKLQRRLYKLWGLLKANPTKLDKIEAAAEKFED